MRWVYNVPLAFQCIYGYSDERGNEISGGGKRVEIAWPLVCKTVSFYRGKCGGGVRGGS